MNPDYLGKLFKKETGIKFSDWLIATRIHLAEKLLRHTRLSVAEIAQKAGFADKYSYFCRQFKKITGATPGEYRKAHENTGYQE